MNKFKLTLNWAVREELEAAWRGRLEEAQERYQAATRRYRKSVAESNGLEPAAAERARQLARREQVEAMLEFRRILGIFAELTVHGRINEEEPPANTNGADQ